MENGKQWFLIHRQFNYQSKTMTKSERAYQRALKRLPKTERGKKQKTKLDLTKIRNLDALPVEIEALTALTTLDLAQTDITDISRLAKLKKLKWLNLKGTKVANLTPLTQLKHLAYLNIAATPIVDLHPLGSLTQLRELNIENTAIRDLTAISKLIKLTTLNAAETKIRDLAPLNDFIHLKVLSINGTNITTLKSLSNLINLRKLYCNRTAIYDLAPLSGLKKLNTLSCMHTQISDLSPLAQLNRLKNINVASTHVQDLKPLKVLIKNGITVRWRFTVGTGLILQDCPLQDPPIPIVKKGRGAVLAYWNSDNLVHQRIQQVINSKSRTLNLSGLGKIKQLPPSIKKVTHITKLNISHTSIDDLTPFRYFHQLKYVNLNHSKVNSLQPLKHLIERGVPVKHSAYNNRIGIYIEHCPLENPPIQVAKQGGSAILSYWKQQKKYIHLYEAKLIILGSSKTGKTTLVKKLMNPNFTVPRYEQLATTVGVDLHEGWAFPHPSFPTLHFNTNIWDFGAQSARYLTHFITPQALYIVMANHRTTIDELDYWLDMVSFGSYTATDPMKNGSVLVILNETNHQSIQHLHIENHQKKHPFISLIFMSVDLSKSDVRFEPLKQKIQGLLTQLPLVQGKYPPEWVNIREHLYQLRVTEPYITWETFCKICKKNKVKTQESQEELCQYLTNIGLLVQYDASSNLEDIIIIDPKWAVEAVKILS